MKITIPLDHSQRYEEFPITRTKVFLAHAAVSPFPARVCNAIRDYCIRNSQTGQWEYLYSDIERQTRERAATLIGGDAEEIAFVPSTSAGLSIIACGLPWQAGDNVVVADGEFPANVYPWMNLYTRGVEVRFIKKNGNGGIGLEEVMQSVDDKTRLVTLSSVDFITGHRIDLSTIGNNLHEKDILFCVDAVQSLGALPFDSTYVDFATGSAHKWLMGPMGVGILYVNKALFDELQPAFIGWKSVQDNKTYLQYNLKYADSAQRYEPGSQNVLGIVGLHASLGIILEVGVNNIANRLAKTRQFIAQSLKDMKYEVISPVNAVNGSAIISFTSERNNISAIRKILDSKGFVVSIRDKLDGSRCIRVAPHFYNSDEEIMAFLDCLNSISD